MKLVVQIRLMPDAEQTAKLKATVERVNAAANWVAGMAFGKQTANVFELRKLTYHQVRKKFDLSSQQAQLAIKAVSDAYKRDKTIKVTFRPHAAIAYDQRTMSFKGIDKVSLLTLEGRTIVPFILGKYQAARMGLDKGQCDLVLRADGNWFLLVTVNLPDETPIPVTDFIGIDLGVVNIATDSDGGQMPAEKVEKARRKYGDRRRKLQQAATSRSRRGKRPRALHRKLERDKAREARYQNSP